MDTNTFLKLIEVTWIVMFLVSLCPSSPELVSGCGGPRDMSGESGTFSSWNYPNSYDNGKSCTWDITVDPDKVIHLWFEEFALEDTEVCSADFVTLRDSLGIIGKYCGYTKPNPVVSLTNHLTIFFDTNDRKTDQGFKAHFKAVSPEPIAGAGGFLQGDQGTLMTPGFPEQNYLNGVLYQWKITVPEGERVRLTFTSFDLVPEVCGDFIQIYDGHTAGSSLVGKFCGVTPPQTVESSRNTMVVRFKSDNTLTSKGFSATYTKSSLPPLTTTPKPTTTTTRTTTPRPTTGGPIIIEGRKGVVHSVGYPNAYPAHLRTSWEISVAKGFLVKLEITDLAITGETGQCEEDKLIISDKYSNLGTHCGYILPPVVVSASETISLTFQSDSRLTDRGFSARWEAVYPEDIAEIQGCGFSSKEETGVIKSQNWPMNYKANTECMWNIAVPFGKKITLTFTHFDLEGKDLLTSKCYDNIMIYDINNLTNGLMSTHGAFCGTSLPGAIQTKGNRLMIRFHSDLFTEAKGFRAYWTTDPSLPAPTEPPAQPNPWDDIPIEWPTACGKPAIPPHVMSRIVNGEEATPHSWPWQIIYKNNPIYIHICKNPRYSHTCGGTLIHKNWVLTAAHCFIRYADELQRWQMCLGKHNLTYTEPTQDCFKITGIYRHEGFQYPTMPTVEYDIALIRLEREVTPTDEVSYACLPPEEEVLAGGKKCYATGWGDETGDSQNPKPSEALNQVALPVVPYDTCKRMDYWWFQVKPSMICCGYTLPDELKSVCQGDSGGPLVCQEAPGSPWEVHGITSFGPVGCIMNKKPSVFTRTSAYIDWIENVIRRELYYEHTSGCGGPLELTGTSGNVSSMHFPGFYDNNAQCQWNIRVPEGKLIHLRFSNFSLEESLNCINDKVTISDTTSSLGVFCSHVAPNDIVSDGNTLHMSFSSNDRVTDTGFTATWKAIDPSETPCGGIFNSEVGEFTSPNWPHDYPSQAVCTWRISVPASKTINVVFTHFEVQAVNVAGSCVDYVEIFAGGNLTSQGSTVVVIRFLSNGANHQKGFRGYWTTDGVKGHFNGAVEEKP
uniref:Zgc:154142 n=1 Tax=Salarias fasciatus TaxID=181472 RepID=A0A672HRX5_SALFA